MTSVIAKTIGASIVVFLILVAQRRDNSALAAVAATVPIGTLVGFALVSGPSSCRWTEQVDLAVRQALQRGQTTLPRLSERLPATWQRRLRAIASATVS